MPSSPWVARRRIAESKPMPLSLDADLDLLRVDAGERDLDLGGLGVLRDVGQRLLDQAIDRQLRRRAEVDMLELLASTAISLRCAELADQDLQRGHQPEVAERRGPQVLDDPALQGDAAVERLVQVGEALEDLRACVLPSRDLSRAASSLAAVSRAPSSS